MLNLTQKEALQKAWNEHYGNISDEIIPPIHPIFKEAFEAGVNYAKENLLWKEEKK